MATLSERFREVEITFDAPPPIPSNWPAGWLHPQSSAAVMRFVDTRFDADKTPAEIRGMFSGVREIAASPMPLRAIFVALAKSGRKAA
jgi:hypothetical protein